MYLSDDLQTSNTIEKKKRTWWEEKKLHAFVTRSHFRLCSQFNCNFIMRGMKKRSQRSRKLLRFEITKKTWKRQTLIFLDLACTDKHVQFMFSTCIVMLVYVYMYRKYTRQYSHCSIPQPIIYLCYVIDNRLTCSFFWCFAQFFAWLLYKWLNICNRTSRTSSKQYQFFFEWLSPKPSFNINNHHFYWSLVSMCSIVCVSVRSVIFSLSPSLSIYDSSSSPCLNIFILIKFHSEKYRRILSSSDTMLNIHELLPHLPRDNNQIYWT